MALANILHLLRHISFKRSAFECSNEHRVRDCFCAKIKGHWCCFLNLLVPCTAANSTLSGWLLWMTQVRFNTSANIRDVPRVRSFQIIVIKMKRFYSTLGVRSYDAIVVGGG